jgi:polysaccharide deacetylase family protein (PEP-CTERM system associated)
MGTAARQGAPTGASTELRESAPAALEARPFETGRSWQRPPGSPSCHALTCDVEDYFHVSAFERVIPKSSWNERECRLPRNIDRVLQLLSDAGASGTFFTLGWVAERFPSLVRQIADAGHEIASHGMLHRRVFEQTPDEFRADAGRAKRLLEDTSGTEVLGYRAPSWSIDLRTPWAHGILRELGYRYSSSIYPIAHDHYGVPNAPTAPFYPRSADILEIPASTVRLAGRNWPAAGGGYFRALPLAVSLWLLRYAERTQATPMLFYFHPWEIDAEQPRVAGASRKARFRHYLNLDKMEPRLTVLLSAFSWGRMDRIFPTSA